MLGDVTVDRRRRRAKATVALEPPRLGLLASSVMSKQARTQDLPCLAVRRRCACSRLLPDALQRAFGADTAMCRADPVSAAQKRQAPAQSNGRAPLRGLRYGNNHRLSGTQLVDSTL